MVQSEASPLKLPIIFRNKPTATELIFIVQMGSVIKHSKTFERKSSKTKDIKIETDFDWQNNTSNHWKQLIEVLLFLNFLKTISDLSSKKHTF
jgi:hypothetical protein